MKLYQIWNATPAWKALQALKKKPQLAYDLLTYAKKVGTELTTCNEIREQCVYEISGVTPGEMANIPEGTPEFEKFRALFNEKLQVESGLEVFHLTLGKLIESLGAEAGNVISEDDLELLEPFFTP